MDRFRGSDVKQTVSIRIQPVIAVAGEAINNNRIRTRQMRLYFYQKFIQKSSSVVDLIQAKEIVEQESKKREDPTDAQAVMRMLDDVIEYFQKHSGPVDSDFKIRALQHFDGMVNGNRSTKTIQAPVLPPEITGIRRRLSSDVQTQIGMTAVEAPRFDPESDDTIQDPPTLQSPANALEIAKMEDFNLSRQVAVAQMKLGKFKLLIANVAELQDLRTELAENGLKTPELTNNLHASVKTIEAAIVERLSWPWSWLHFVGAMKRIVLEATIAELQARKLRLMETLRIEALDTSRFSSDFAKTIQELIEIASQKPDMPPDLQIKVREIIQAKHDLRLMN